MTGASDKQTRDVLIGMSDSLTNKHVVCLPSSLTVLSNTPASFSIANCPLLCTLSWLSIVPPATTARRAPVSLVPRTVTRATALLNKVHTIHCCRHFLLVSDLGSPRVIHSHIFIECSFTEQLNGHLVPRFHDFQSFRPGVAAVPAIPLENPSGDNNGLCSSINPFAFNFHGLENIPSDFGIHSSGYSLLGNDLLPPSAFGVTNSDLPLPPHQSFGHSEHGTGLPALPLPDSDAQSTGRSEHGTGLPVPPLPDTNAQSNSKPVLEGFVDENGSAADANISTWSARNPHRPIIPPRTSKPMQLSEAERASRQIAAEQRSSKREALQADIKTYLEEQKCKLDAIATAHGVTVKYLNNIVTSKTHYHATRKPHLMNALMHAKAKEVNSSKGLSPLSLEIICANLCVRSCRGLSIWFE